MRLPAAPTLFSFGAQVLRLGGDTTEPIVLLLDGLHAGVDALGSRSYSGYGPSRSPLREGLLIFMRKGLSLDL